MNKIEKARYNFVLTAGDLPLEKERNVPEAEVTEEILSGKIIRRQLLINTEENDRVRAFMYLPADINGRLPAMLCLHQTNGRSGCEEPAGISGLESLKYGLELAERGYVTLMPDYPYFGTNSTNPYELGYISNTMKGIFNHSRMIDYLESLDFIDRERIGCIGHSLGGHNTIFLGLFEDRLKVLVTSCGICALKEYVKTNGGNLWGWAQDRYMPLISSKYKNDPELVPWDFPEIVEALAPRPLFINAPLHDENMNYPGNKIIIDKAITAYEELGASKLFRYENPDVQHSFPENIRQKAYDFIDGIFQEM